MPSTSAKQHRFMEAIAHNKAFAKKAGVPQSVGREFANADKGKTFKKGGDMKESKKMVEKEVAFMKKKGAPKSMIKHEEAEMCGGGKVKKMAAGGMPGPAGAPMDPRMAAMKGARRRPAMPGGMPGGAPAPTMGGVGPAGPAPTMGMKKGGMASRDAHAEKEGRRVTKELEYDYKHGRPAYKSGGRIASKGEHAVQKQSKRGAEMVKMASGGYVKSADGIAQRGKTRFSQPKMKGRVI